MREALDRHLDRRTFLPGFLSDPVDEVLLRGRRHADPPSVQSGPRRLLRPLRQLLRSAHSHFHRSGQCQFCSPREQYEPNNRPRSNGQVSWSAPVSSRPTPTTTRSYERMSLWRCELSGAGRAAPEAARRTPSPPRLPMPTALSAAGRVDGSASWSGRSRRRDR